MLFNSPIFILLFLPIVISFFYFLVRKDKVRIAIGWLVLSSVIFYGYFRIDYLILFFVLIVINYFIGYQLSVYHKRKHNSNILLVIGIGMNLSVLGYYKYTNFFINNFNYIFETSFALKQIILPLGISFFIFQIIAYIIDSYQGKINKYNFMDFCLFVMYFPQLAAGPLVHYHELIPQFYNKIKFQISYIDIVSGILMFTVGLIKKVLIADQLHIWISTSFYAVSNGYNLTFLEAWETAIALSLQVYFDFSGYSDMALGIASMMGVKLPKNFNSPYQAENIIDFWRRWHITLSGFLRDYIYIPLGGNQNGVVRRYINLMLTMLIGGLWHGASWTFVIWGGIHGLYLIINHVWEAYKAKLGTIFRIPRIINVMLTFVMVTFAWIFFQSQGLLEAVNIIEGMLGMHGIALPIGYELKLGIVGQFLKTCGVNYRINGLNYWSFIHSLYLLILCFVVWFFPNTQKIIETYSLIIFRSSSFRLLSFRRIKIINMLYIVFKNSSLTLSPRIYGILGFFCGIIIVSILIYQIYISEKLNNFIYFQF